LVPSTLSEEITSPVIGVLIETSVLWFPETARPLGNGRQFQIKSYTERFL